MKKRTAVPKKPHAAPNKKAVIIPTIVTIVLLVFMIIVMLFVMRALVK